MTRALYLDCFAGISGDMLLGALLDVGGREETLRATVSALGLEGEVELRVGEAQRGHLAGLRVEVEAGPGPHRTLPQLLATVDAAPLDEATKAAATAVLRRLGRAEAKLHRVELDSVHLHELGGADTLVDVAGAFALLADLGHPPLYCSPLPAEQGGPGRDLPLPAPAALEVLAGSGAVLQPVESGHELVTPTGAAIVATAARFQRPVMRPLAVGYGAGARETPGNLLRAVLGELVASGEGGEAGGEEVVTLLETHLDDLAGNRVAALMAELMEEGALDVALAPIQMKKGRPAHALSVMTRPADAARLTELLLTRSTTFGVRVNDLRRVVAGRRVEEVATPYGRARVKLKLLHGQVIAAAPEFEDCRRLAAEGGHDLGTVLAAVNAAAAGLVGAR